MYKDECKRKNLIFDFRNLPSNQHHILEEVYALETLEALNWFEM